MKQETIVRIITPDEFTIADMHKMFMRASIPAEFEFLDITQPKFPSNELINAKRDGIKFKLKELIESSDQTKDEYRILKDYCVSLHSYKPDTYDGKIKLTVPKEFLYPFYENRIKELDKQIEEKESLLHNYELQYF